MRLDRAIIVAKKDLAEFRKNRFIFASIMIMPIIISLVLPAIYVAPLRMLAEERIDPLDLQFDIQFTFENVRISNATLFDAQMDNVTIENCIIQESIIRNSIVRDSIINGSEIDGCMLHDSIITGSNIVDVLIDDGNFVTGSSREGGDDELESLKDILFNMILLLLIIIPVMIPTVTASYSFVGEKTNRSLEPLLATPASDLELLMGKAGAIFVLSMVATWVSFVLCVASINFLTEPFLGYYPLPNLYWVLVVLLLAPGMCLMSIFTNVLISSKVNDVRVSQQIGGVLVLPVLGFFVLSMAGVVSAGILPLLLFSCVVFAADAGILLLSVRVFRREEILVRWK
ncbi:MAG: ABC transporter permease subunit [Candidatus Thermoplasmatota archaeon]|nr:ABC transporter permease subunit [Candidatus Thermoplasmatota archaeon]